MKIETVLLATDFSSASEEARRLAVDLAQGAQARLHIVNVVPPVSPPGDAAARLKGMAYRIRRKRLSLSVETAVLSGRPAREIVRYARDKGASVIVLGTHGRTGISRVLLGSVAEAVLRLAGRPVLIVPAEREDTISPSTKPAASAPAAESVLPVPHHCVVCASETEDLICEACRTRIRGEAPPARDRA
jgi:universal stress protein A